MQKVFILFHNYMMDGFGNAKLFEDLVTEFDIPFRDRRKYDSLMNGISLSWFDDSLHINDDIFMMIVNNLLNQKKKSKYAYNMLQKKYCTTNTKRESKWEELFGPPTQRERLVYNFIEITLDVQLRLN